MDLPSTMERADGLVSRPAPTTVSAVFEVPALSLNGRLEYSLRLFSARRPAFRFELESATPAAAGTARVQARIEGPFQIVLRKQHCGTMVSIRKTDGTSGALDLTATCHGLGRLSRNKTLKPCPKLIEQIAAVTPSALVRKLEWATRIAIRNAPAGTEVLRFTLPATTAEQAVAMMARNGRVPPQLMDAAGRLAPLVAGEQCLVVRLPLLQRNQWIRRETMISGADVRVSAVGDILVSRRSRRVEEEAIQDTLVGAYAARIAAQPAPGCFEARLRTSLQDLPQLVGPDLAREVASVARRGALGSKCQVTIAIPMAAIGSWFDIPGVKSRMYKPVYGELSLALQTAMRRLLPSLSRQQPYAFTRVNLSLEKTAAMVLQLYACSDAHAGSCCAELVPDATDPESVYRIWKTGRTALCRKLAAERLGVDRQQRQRNLHARRRMEKLAESPWRSQLIRAMLRSEAALLEALISVGHVCAEIGSSRAAYTHSRTAVVLRRLAGCFRRSLSSFYNAIDCEPLTSLLFVEATNAINTALGRNYPIETVVQIKHVDGSEESVLHRSASLSRSQHYTV